MNAEWITVAIQVGTMAVVAAGFIWAVKADNKVLKIRLDSMAEQLSKMDNVLVILAENKGRMDRTDDRVMLTGQRVDALTTRIDGVQNRVDGIGDRMNRLAVPA